MRETWLQKLLLLRAILKEYEYLLGYGLVRELFANMLICFPIIFTSFPDHYITEQIAPTT